MRVGQLSHKGNVRLNNEDSIYSSKNKDLFIIADGMGGHNGGEIASKAAINKSKYFVKNKFENYDKTEKGILSLICDAISYANSYILTLAKKDESLIGMGTTIIIMIIHENIAYIGHVGDSRVYHINDSIKQITADHSLAEELFRIGTITREEALNYPQKNIITRALGCNQKIEVDTHVIKIKENDSILLCTDGLNNMASDDDIFNIINNNNVPNKCVKELVDHANNSGGADNVSVILIKNN